MKRLSVLSLATLLLVSIAPSHVTAAWKLGLKCSVAQWGNSDLDLVCAQTATAKYSWVRLPVLNGQSPSLTKVAAPVAKTSLAKSLPINVGTRQSPVPLGTPAEIRVIGRRWTVRVDSFSRNANEALRVANDFNSPPAPGKVHVLATVTATFIGGAEKSSLAFVPWNLVDRTNKSASTDLCGVTPHPSFDLGELFPGGAGSYDVCFTIAPENVDSAILYLDGDKTLYFATS